MDVEARVRIPRGPHTDARLRRDARGHDGGVRQELAAGVVLGRSAFGGKPEKHTLVLNLTASDHPISGHSEAFTRPAYRPWSQTARRKRGIIPLLHE